MAKARPNRNFIEELNKQLKSKKSKFQPSPENEKTPQSRDRGLKLESKEDPSKKIAIVGAAMIGKAALEDLQRAGQELQAQESQLQRVQQARAVQAATAGELAAQAGQAAVKTYQVTQQELEKKQREDQQEQLERARRQAEARRRIERRQSFLKKQQAKLNPIKLAKDEGFKIVKDYTIPGYYIFDKARELTKRILFGPEKN